MIVSRKARAGLEPHERRGPAAVLVVAEDLDGRAPGRQGAPPDLVAPEGRRGTARLGHRQLRPQSCFVAIPAPSTRPSNFTPTTLGRISVEPATVAKPQQAPAMT